MRLRLIAKICCIINGREYAQGEEVRGILPGDQVAKLVQYGTIGLGFPDEEKGRVGGMVMYRGVMPALPTPSGVMYRCVPVVIEDWHEREMHGGSDDFARIPESAVYVGSGATVENFEREIASSLPEKPRVIFIRDCGAGDVIMSTVAVREFKRRIPDAEITYATLPVHMELLKGADFVDCVLSVHDMELVKYSLIVNWSRAVENYSIERNRGSRVMSFARHLGIEKVENDKPFFRLTQEERNEAERLIEGRGEGGPLIGYVMRAAAWNRTWPLWRAEELCEEIRNAAPNSKIVLIDEDGKTGFEGDGIINLCGKTPTFRVAAEVLEKCGVVIAQDSGLAHACGAMGVPTLVLMGSIPPEKRYSHYGNVECIFPEGRTGCCPCWDWQEVYKDGEKKGMPISCHDSGRNKCLETITALEVAEKIISMYQDTETPEVSVCVLTHGGGEHLDKCLVALNRARFHGEILLLINGGKDISDEITAAYPKVKIFRGEENIGVIKGRNFLARKAAGEKLLFLDDDQYISEDSVVKMLNKMYDSDAKIVCAEANMANDMGVGAAVKERTGEKKEYGGAGGMLVDRNFFEALGGFDEIFGMAYCEDADFCWRAAEKGEKWEWAQDAGIAHEGHRTLPAQRTFDNEREHRKSHETLRKRWSDRLLPFEGIMKLGFRNARQLGEYRRWTRIAPVEDEKKKILMVADTPFWAVARNVDAIYRRLRNKYEIHRACFSNVREGRGGRGYMPMCATNLEDFDLVVARILLHMPESDFRMLKKLPPRKVAVTIPAYHCFDDERFTGIFEERMKCCRSVFCVSDGIYERTAEYFKDSDKDVYFTPQGIDTSEFFNKRSDRNEEFTVGWAGNVNHGHPRDHKRFYEIILPLIEKMSGACRFRLAARGLSDRLRRGLEEMGVIVGEVGFDGMAEFYNSVDVFLNASVSEAIASTTCEAIACGTPVVTTRVGHAENIIVDGLNGALVEPDVEEFEAAIRRFMNADYGRVFAANRYVAQEVYNWDALVEYTDAAMECAMGGRRAGAAKEKKTA